MLEMLLILQSNGQTYNKVKWVWRNKLKSMLKKHFYLFINTIYVNK